MYFQKAVG